MARIELFTTIDAPPDRCFDLSRSVDFHAHAAADTGERAVDGKQAGLLELGDQVTWHARHFGIRQRLSVRITAYQRPAHFQDVMVRGAFAHLTHDHYFKATDGGTVMRDVFDFAAPFGIIGRAAELTFLEAYMRRFLLDRNRLLKAAAESAEWMKFVPRVT